MAMHRYPALAHGEVGVSGGPLSSATGCAAQDSSHTAGHVERVVREEGETEIEKSEGQRRRRQRVDCVRVVAMLHHQLGKRLVKWQWQHY